MTDNHKNIAVVVPSCRPESLVKFLSAWDELFWKHRVRLVIVHDDGDKPLVELRAYDNSVLIMNPGARLNAWDIMGDGQMVYAKHPRSLIIGHTAGVRNLGFAAVAKGLPDAEYIITLDDDLTPVNDSIQQHITQLQRRASHSWMSSIDSGPFPRGMPYNARQDSEVMMSHGIWLGVPDLDGPTQLVLGENPPVTFYRGVIPKGVNFPLSSMNFAFRRRALPHVFMAPMSMETWGFDRFEDIWGLLEAKRELDALGYATVSGYSTVRHDRASNVFVNIRKESRALPLNEGFWKGQYDDEYFDWYHAARKAWYTWMSRYIAEPVI